MGTKWQLRGPDGEPSGRSRRTCTTGGPVMSCPALDHIEAPVLKVTAAAFSSEWRTE